MATSLGKAGGCIVVAALALFLLNLSTWWSPLRAPDLEACEGYFLQDVTLSHTEALAEIGRRPGEGDLEYTRRMVRVVGQSLAHIWTGDHYRGEGVERFHARLPLNENWLLYLYAGGEPYEFADPLRTLERGIGLCSQHALCLAGLLEREGIEVSLVGLSGHVLTQVEVEGRAYLCDPDFKVIVPHGLEEVGKNPELVRPFYAPVFASEVASDAKFGLDDMVETFGAEGNSLRGGVSHYLGSRRVKIERYSYWAIWALPSALLALGLSLLWLARRSAPVRED